MSTTIWLRDNRDGRVHFVKRGQRVYCNAPVIGGTLLETADVEDLCADCIAIVRQLEWLARTRIKEEDGGYTSRVRS